MKKTWNEPKILVQQFVPNEYVAACGEENRVYKFSCDAGSKWKNYHVYLNGEDGIAHTEDDIDWSARSGQMKPYSPCGTTHDAKVDSDFQSGYMYEYQEGWFGGGSNIGNPINVIVWTDNGTNTHCTTNLNMNSWTTAKS